MAQFSVDLKDLGAALAKDVKGRYSAALSAMRRTARTYGPRLAQTAVDAAQPKPVDRGTYRRSFQAEDTPDGVLFGNVSPHAGLIEEGRRAGAPMPPLAPIAAWAQRKKIALRGKSVKRQKAAMRIAYVIARAIARRGIPGHHIMAKVDKQLRVLVNMAVKEALSKPASGSKPK